MWLSWYKLKFSIYNKTLALPNNSPCNDGNACTKTDECISGVCIGSNSVNCSVVPVCHLPVNTSLRLF